MSRWVYVALLLSLITSFATNAAIFEMQEDFGDDAFNLDADISNIEMQEIKEQQATKQVESNYQLVLDLIKKRQYKEADVKITALIQQTPNQPVYYNLKAFLLLVEKNLAGAEQSFLKAVELDEKNVQALSGLAKLKLDNKQFNLAKQYANKVLVINPQIIKAYQVLVDIAIQQQGIEAVEEILLDALVKAKDNLEAELAIMNSLGEIYISKKQPKKIMLLATDLVERNKDDISALSFFAKTQVINKDKSGAEKTLRQIITQQPNSAKHLLLLARLLDKQKDKETEIISLLDKAAQNPDNLALAFSYKSAVLIKQQRYKQAFAVAQQVDELNPSKSVGKILKGDVYFASKKYQKALKSYSQAINITPNIKVLDIILKILKIQKKHNDVVTLLEKELTRNKDDVAIQFRLAVAYQNAGQLDLSSRQYEAVLTKQKNNVIALNNLAGIYSKKNNPKAVILAKQAYQLAPKSSAIADTYGYILLKNGNNQESLMVLKQAAELDSKLTAIQLHLAEAYIANQIKPQAKSILQNLLIKNAIKKEDVHWLMERL